jgi:WD40 repeat protein/serine/threonine protein kinase
LGWLRGKSEPPPGRRWQPGDVVAGLYEVRRPLGAGGMGVVDLVRHLGWRQDLAVKSPLPDLWAGPGGLSALVTEAKVWVDLPVHPNICTCYYVRVLDGAPRIFAEYVDGGNLAEALRAGRFRTVPEKLDVAIQMALGLHVAHMAGVVHRDVKPANVLVTRDGTAKITDFGLARAQLTNDRSRAGADSIFATRMGMTPAYASPEQMTGGRVDQSTDVWSWAVSVLELFVGRVTWSSGAIADRVLADYLAGDRCPIPADVATVLAECLAPPGNRPTDLAAVARRLIRVHQREAGRPYPRPVTGTVAARADELNNKALSMMDLGESDQAAECWTQALELDERHLDSVFNNSLVQWRAARVTDDQVVGELGEVGRIRRRAGVDDGRAEYLLGLIHLERGDFASAKDCLQQAGRLVPEDPEIAAALRTATGSGTRELRMITAHPDGIVSVALSADGRRALSAGEEDLVVRHWDLETGQCLAELTGHIDEVGSIAMSADGRLAVSASGDRTIRVWNLATGECVQVLTGHTDAVNCVALTPDGLQAVSGSDDQTVRVWNLVTGTCRYTLTGHEMGVQDVRIASTGRYAVTGDWNGWVYCWDLANGMCVRSLKVDGLLGEVHPSADGRRVMCVSLFNSIATWVETATGEELMRFGHLDGIGTVALAGGLMVSGNAEGSVSWWDTTTRRCLCTIAGHAGHVRSVAMTADGSHALSGGADGTLRWWTRVPGIDVLTSHTRPRGSDVLAAEQKEFTRRINRAEVSLVAGGFAEATAELRAARAIPGYQRDPALLKLWRLAGSGGRRTDFVDARLVAYHPSPDRNLMTTMALAADGRHAIAGDSEGNLGWYDLESEDRPRVFGRHWAAVKSVTLTADLRLALSCGDDNTLRLWDTSGGNCVGVLDDHTDIVYDVAMTSDGRQALSVSKDGTFRHWDLRIPRTCVATRADHPGQLCAVAMTPDGRYGMYGGQEGVLRLWEPRGSIRELTGHTATVCTIAMTPDARVALSGDADGVIRQWDLATGECTRTLAAHNRMITSVAMTSDGRHALSADEKGTMRLWDLETGQSPYEEYNRTHYSCAVALSRNADRAVYTATNSALIVYEFDWNHTHPG